MAKKKDMVKVKFCPKCKSFNVKYVFGLSSWIGMSPKMRCLKCKFEMPSFPVLEVDKSKLNSPSKSLSVNLKGNKNKLKKKIAKKVIKRKTKKVMKK